MKKRIQQLKKNRKAGTSLAYVMCISALLIAFALAITYTAGMMIATANKRLTQERCYQLAASYANVLDGALKTEGSDFNKFAKEFLGSSYADYDPGSPDNTTYRFRTDTEPGVAVDYGTLEIVMYKVANDTETEPVKLQYVSGGNYTDIITNLQKEKHYRYELVVTVIASFEGFEYHYTTKYDCAEQFEVQCYHDGNLIYWDSADTKWRVGATGASAGAEYTGTITEEAPVTYRLLTEDGKVLSRSFENLYQEAGTEEAGTEEPTSETGAEEPAGKPGTEETGGGGG